MYYILIAIFLPFKQADMKYRYGCRLLQIFNAILLRFSRRFRNSPRPWVRHTHRPAPLDTLEKLIRRLNLQCRFSHTCISLSLQPRLVNKSCY